MADALRHGWSDLDRKDGRRCWVYSAEWASIRLSICSECIGSMRAAENSIAARLVQRMGSEPLMREFETDAFARAFSRQANELGMCVELLRVSRCVGCFLAVSPSHWHTGDLAAVVARGCFRCPLSVFRAMAWLVDEPPGPATPCRAECLP
eukprot:1461-Amphidinium_carterae.3